MKRARVDDRIVALIALVAGIVAALSNASPTGAQPYDAIVLIASVAALTWASASAPWWVGPLVAGVGAAIALQPVVAVVGAAACVVGLWVGTQRRDLTITRAVVAGVALNVLCRSELELFTGASALVGICLAVLLSVKGLLRRHRMVQRRARLVVAVAAAVLVVAGGLTTLAALWARSDVSDGQAFVADGIDHLRAGDYVAAALAFDEATDAFDSAHATIARPWAQAGRFVPIAAQNRIAVEGMVAASADASRELANASLFIDADDLRPLNGRFDLDALAEVEAPVTAAYAALIELRKTVDRVDSPWLLGTVDERLDSVAAEFDANVDRFDTAVTALQLAPDLLGGNGARQYFVAFTTPAEARGLGGFMGNYAVLTADEGELTLTDFGRTGDLNAGGDDERRITGPQDWLDRWGRFGFTNGPDGTAGEVPWSNVTMSPQFPSTAQVIAELFPQSGGEKVDGVFAMDPYVLEAMVGFTGPVKVPGVEQRLTDSNTAQFLLFDQYLITDAAERADFLQDVAVAVFDELLSGALPAPTVVADDLDPFVDDGRLVAWAGAADEQAFFERIGLGGALPGLTTESGDSAEFDEASGIPGPVVRDGFQVVVNNAGANKLDAWLGRDITYRGQFDAATRSVVGTVSVEFTNDGPTEGLPDGVIGNYVDDPIGTNRMLVSIYTAFPVTGATFAGEPVEIELGREAGWYVSSHYVVLPPGESRTLTVSVAGVITSDLDGPVSDAYELVVGTQPLVIDAEYNLEVTTPSGAVLVAATGSLPGVTFHSPRTEANLTLV